MKCRRNTFPPFTRKGTWMSKSGDPVPILLECMIGWNMASSRDNRSFFMPTGSGCTTAIAMPPFCFFFLLLLFMPSFLSGRFHRTVPVSR